MLMEYLSLTVNIVGLFIAVYPYIVSKNKICYFVYQPYTWDLKSARLKVALWNNSNKPIQYDKIVKYIKIDAVGKDILKSVRVIKETDYTIGLEVARNAEEDNSQSITFEYLDNKDGGVLDCEILTQRAYAADITIKGKIIGFNIFKKKSFNYKVVLLYVFLLVISECTFACGIFAPKGAMKYILLFVGAVFYPAVIISVIKFRESLIAPKGLLEAL